jgi:hypothetical protein
MEAPTAVQADEDEHETLFRKPPCDPDGFGVDLTVHFVPFHCSASVTPAKGELSVVPTAVQAEDEVHDTEFRLGDGPGLGVDWMLHAVSSHRSASVPRLEAPTAVHAVEDVHDTPEKPLPCAPDGFGVDCTAQEVPFHRSASVTPVPELSRKVPAHKNWKQAIVRSPDIQPEASAAPWRLGIEPVPCLERAPEQRDPGNALALRRVRDAGAESAARMPRPTIRMN